MARKTKKEAVKPGEELVKPRDMVNFRFSNSPFHDDGAEEKLHVVHARLLEGKGFGSVVEGSEEDTSEEDDIDETV